MPLRSGYQYDPASDPFAENEEVDANGHVKERVLGAEPLSQTRNDIEAVRLQRFLEDEIIRMAREAMQAEPQPPPEPERPTGPIVRPRGWRTRRKD